MPNDNKYLHKENYSWADFRRNLRTLMNSNHYNGKEFAQKIGIAPTTVTRYFYERVPDTLTLWRIADFWDVSIDWLIGKETSGYQALPDGTKRLIDGYNSASPEDRHIIDMILKKYEQTEA